MSDTPDDVRKQAESLVAKYRAKKDAERRAEEDAAQAAREEEARLTRIDNATPMAARRLAKQLDDCGLQPLGVFVFADEEGDDTLIVRCHVHVVDGADGDWFDEIESEDPGHEFARFTVDWDHACTDVWLEYDGERIADAVAVGIAVDRLEEWMKKAGQV